MVALAYATRHPGHPAKLILISTEAAGGTYRERRVALFERFGGPEVGALARRRFLEVQGHADQASLDDWRRLAFPLYTRMPDIAAALPAHLVQFERFANCRHAVIPDAPARAVAVIRDFIERRS
jgi:pimeloyl-ACP methyl ester carboxylesterase